MKKWWHNKVAYEIYPKSFKDSNGDGIGDLPGIIEKLDYLKELGVDILWICPIYDSPFVDQGYDIADYYKIAECFGTTEDFDRLLEETKKRDMYVIMDLVVNHCSSEHVWFKEALKDPEGEYAKRFYFRKGRCGKEPSNYRSYFGGNMWEPVPGFNDWYYYHSFAKEQPDLNWNNPVVVQAVYDMVNWWLDKGVAGFRIDAIINIKKDLSFPSYEADGPDGLASTQTIVAGGLAATDGPSVTEMLNALKDNTFAKHDAFTVGEVFDLEPGTLDEFIGENGCFSTIFDFGLHIQTNCEHGWFASREVTFDLFKEAIINGQSQTAGTCFMANITENHDEPRGIDIFLPKYMEKEAGAKLLATIMLSLRGIPFLYQGQEIGMVNKDFKSLSEYNDIWTLDQYEQALAHGFTREEALTLCKTYSRDNARTPMQWDDSACGGFTTGTPWLACNETYKTINVASQEHNPDSILSYYKKMIKLRKDEELNETFVYGEFVPVYDSVDKVLAFYRKDDKHKVLVVANFNDEAVSLEIDKQDQGMPLRIDNEAEGNCCPEILGDKLVLAKAQVCVYAR